MMIKRGDIITAKYLNGLEQLSRSGISAAYETNSRLSSESMPIDSGSFGLTPFFLSGWFNPDTGKIRYACSNGYVFSTGFTGSNNTSPYETAQLRSPFSEDVDGAQGVVYRQFEAQGRYISEMDIQSENDIGQWDILKTQQDGGTYGINSWKLVMCIRCSVKELTSYTDTQTGITFDYPYPFARIQLIPKELKVSSLHSLRSESVWGDGNEYRFIIACCEGDRNSYRDSDGFYFLAPNRKAVMNGSATDGINSYYQRVNGCILPSPHVRLSIKNI